MSTFQLRGNNGTVARVQTAPQRVFRVTGSPRGPAGKDGTDGAQGVPGPAGSSAADELPGEFFWSGHNWTRRSAGGAPQYNDNWISDDTASWIDDDGYLHLKMINTDGSTPYGAEIDSTRGGYNVAKWGYGTYRFTVGNTQAGNSDNIVFGLFTYDGTADADVTNNEIDIELGGFSYGAPQLNSTYFRPGIDPEPAKRSVGLYAADVTGNPVAVYEFVWLPGIITWNTWLDGDVTHAPDITTSAVNGEVYDITNSSGHFTGTHVIPVPRNENVIINLWVAGDNPEADPDSTPTTEVIIRSFEFQPLLSESLDTTGFVKTTGDQEILGIKTFDDALVSLSGVITPSVRLSSDYGSLSANAIYNGGWKYVDTGFASLIENDGGDGGLNFYYADSGAPGDAISWHHTMSYGPSGIYAGDVNITNVADPVNAQDAATKAYVDSAGGGTGDVVGPASSTDNAIARFDSTTGKLLQNSTASITDDGIIDLVGTSGGLRINPNADGGEYNLSVTATGTLALFGSGGQTLHFNLYDGDLKTGSSGTVRLTNAGALTNIASLNTYTIPASNIVGLTDAQTLTNKTINGGSNTISAIANASLINSTVTIGSTSVSLGATATTVAGLTLTTPTIASFTNATHNHTNSAGGGTLGLSALSATGTPSSSTYLRGDNTWATVSGSGDMVLASTQTNTGAKTFNNNTLILAGSTSGTTTLQANATAGSGTVIFPTTGTLATIAGSETLTSKTLTSPTITTPTLNATTIATDTTTGLTIGTGTTQKLGFFNATPVAQQSATSDLGVTLSNLGLRASGTAYPITTTGLVAVGSGGFRSQPTLRTSNAGATLTSTSPLYNWCNTATGNQAYTLPAASSSAGQTLYLKKTSSDASTVTINRAGSDTIDGATSLVLSNQYDYVLLINDGSANWNILASNAPRREIAIPFAGTSDETSTSYVDHYNLIAFDKSKYAGYTGIYFKVVMDQQGAGNYTTYAKLLNHGTGVDVTSGEVTIVNQAQYNAAIVMTANIAANLASGDAMYRFNLKATAGGTTAVLWAGLVVRY